MFNSQNAFYELEASLLARFELFIVGGPARKIEPVSITEYLIKSGADPIDLVRGQGRVACPDRLKNLGKAALLAQMYTVLIST